MFLSLFIQLKLWCSLPPSFLSTVLLAFQLSRFICLPHYSTQATAAYSPSHSLLHIVLHLPSSQSIFSSCSFFPMPCCPDSTAHQDSREAVSEEATTALNAVTLQTVIPSCTVRILKKLYDIVETYCGHAPNKVHLDDCVKRWCRNVHIFWL